MSSPEPFNQPLGAGGPIPSIVGIHDMEPYAIVGPWIERVGLPKSLLLLFAILLCDFFKRNFRTTS